MRDGENTFSRFCPCSFALTGAAFFSLCTSALHCTAALHCTTAQECSTAPLNYCTGMLHYSTELLHRNAALLHCCTELLHCSTELLLCCTELLRRTIALKGVGKGKAVRHISTSGGWGSLCHGIAIPRAAAAPSANALRTAIEMALGMASSNSGTKRTTLSYLECTHNGIVYTGTRGAELQNNYSFPRQSIEKGRTCITLLSTWLEKVHMGEVFEFYLTSICLPCLSLVYNEPLRSQVNLRQSPGKCSIIMHNLVLLTHDLSPIQPGASPCCRSWSCRVSTYFVNARSSSAHPETGSEACPPDGGCHGAPSSVRRVHFWSRSTSRKSSLLWKWVSTHFCETWCQYVPWILFRPKFQTVNSRKNDWMVRISRDPTFLLPPSLVSSNSGPVFPGNSKYFWRENNRERKENPRRRLSWRMRNVSRHSIHCIFHDMPLLRIDSTITESERALSTSVMVAFNF